MVLNNLRRISENIEDRQKYKGAIAQSQENIELLIKLICQSNYEREEEFSFSSLGLRPYCNDHSKFITSAVSNVEKDRMIEETYNDEHGDLPLSLLKELEDRESFLKKAIEENLCRNSDES